MTPQQLLIETQKAAGDPNLSSWFESLKEEGKQLKIAAQVIHIHSSLGCNNELMNFLIETERR
jgi:hypothetical protein